MRNSVLVETLNFAVKVPIEKVEDNRYYKTVHQVHAIKKNGSGRYSCPHVHFAVIALRGQKLLTTAGSIFCLDRVERTGGTRGNGTAA